MIGEACLRNQLELSVRTHLVEGDARAAATAVIEALGPSVLGYLTTLVPVDDAYDAYSRFQENLWRGLPRFRWECSLRAWAYRIAWNAVARLARDAYRRRREPLPSVSRFAVSAVPSTEASRHDALAELSAGLSPEERTLLALRIGKELEWDEVAAVLAERGEETSPATLRKRFERLKNKLVDLARERGLLC